MNLRVLGRDAGSGALRSSSSEPLIGSLVGLGRQEDGLGRRKLSLGSALRYWVGKFHGGNLDVGGGLGSDKATRRGAEGPADRRGAVKHRDVGFADSVELEPGVLSSGKILVVGLEILARMRGLGRSRVFE